MKKLLCILCVLSLAVCGLCLSAAAAENAKIVQAFCQENTLYVYGTVPDGKLPEGAGAEANIAGEPAYPADRPAPVTLGESGLPVSYLFLVDNSTSMPAFRSAVEAFVGQIAENGGDTAQYALATFGSAFELVRDYTGDKDALLDAARGITYDANQTSLYQGLMDALDHLTTYRRERGELVNLILITDGIEVDRDGPTEREVSDRIAASAPVLIHTMGIAGGQAGSEDALKILGAFSRAASGVHTVFGYGGSSAAALADEITGYVNGLCVSGFRLSLHEAGEPFDVQVVFSTDTALLFEDSCTGVQSLSLRTAAPPSLEEPTASPSPENPTPPPSGAVETPQTSPLADDPGAEQPEQKPTVWPFATAGAAVLAVILGVVLAVRRKKAAMRPPAGAIYMRLEVVAGAYAGKTDVFYLADELLVGRDRACDIVWKDAAVAERHARIFQRDHVIYIEDLETAGGTAIGGMRIHGSNRLRSGDEISVGPVRFVLKF